MKKLGSLYSCVTISLIAAPLVAQTPTVTSPYKLSIFATAPSGLSAPDSIAVLGDYIFVGYGDNHKPDGSCIIQRKLGRAANIAALFLAVIVPLRPPPEAMSSTEASSPGVSPARTASAMQLSLQARSALARLLELFKRSLRAEETAPDSKTRTAGIKKVELLPQAGAL